MTARHERETLVVFSDEDLLNGGDAIVYTFREAIKRKCLQAGGRVVREHVRDGRVEAWDLVIPASLVRIRFKSRARAEASSASMRARKAHAESPPQARNGIRTAVPNPSSVRLDPERGSG
jgi:hypothetical protein